MARSYLEHVLPFHLYRHALNEPASTVEHGRDIWFSLLFELSVERCAKFRQLLDAEVGRDLEVVAKIDAERFKLFPRTLLEQPLEVKGELRLYLRNVLNGSQPVELQR